MKNLLLAFVAVLTLQTATAQTQVGEVTLPNSVNFSSQDLTLNGAGIRKKAWFKLYSAGLYLTNKSGDANSIINADETMAIKLQITSSMVSSKKMKSAVNDGFDAAMNGDTSSLSSEIEKFIGFFNEEIVEGTVFDITYQKGKGAVIYRNGKEKGVITGMKFKKALFAIWLGSDPADDDLKEGLLGK